MCGIVGLYNFPAKGDVLTRMLHAIAHRGPDAEGVCESQSHGADVRLGHRRLSIIDLSEAANQPFEKDGLVIVYNGEIYNYRALQQELVAQGVRFRTTSDTEVLLEAWRRWGPASLNRLRGMFAFAMLDQRTGRLILAGIRLGSSRCSLRAEMAAWRSPPSSRRWRFPSATRWLSIRRP